MGPSGSIRPASGKPSDQMYCHGDEQMNTQDETRRVFCIYVETTQEGEIPVERNDGGCPVVYETEDEAQRVIAEITIERLKEFLKGQRDFDDAMTVEEYIVEVDVYPDGSISDEKDQYFGCGNW